MRFKDVSTRCFVRIEREHVAVDATGIPSSQAVKELLRVRPFDACVYTRRVNGVSLDGDGCFRKVSLTCNFSQMGAECVPLIGTLSDELCADGKSRRPTAGCVVNWLVIQILMLG